MFDISFIISLSVHEQTKGNMIEKAMNRLKNC